MNEEDQDSLSLPELLRRLEARNRKNVALAGLGIRTSADVFEATQTGSENAGEESWGERFGGRVRQVGLNHLEPLGCSSAHQHV